jgi:hypothetical protein
VELYLHFPIHLHGMVLNDVQGEFYIKGLPEDMRCIEKSEC